MSILNSYEKKKRFSDGTYLITYTDKSNEKIYQKAIEKHPDLGLSIGDDEGYQGRHEVISLRKESDDGDLSDFWKTVRRLEGLK